MEYLVQYRNDIYIMGLNGSQLQLLSWLYDNSILPDDFTWDALGEISRVEFDS